MLHRLLEQSEEKQATSLRTAAIESESELVEIGWSASMAVDAQAIKRAATRSLDDDVGRVARRKWISAGGHSLVRQT